MSIRFFPSSYVPNGWFSGFKPISPMQFRRIRIMFLTMNADSKYFSNEKTLFSIGNPGSPESTGFGGTTDFSGTPGAKPPENPLFFG
jgi:hypothetical protein